MLLAVTVVSGCGPASPVTPADPAVVATTAGPVRGVVVPGAVSGAAPGADGCRCGERGYRLFQGIPYAAAPVGAMRWQPPVGPEPWRAVRDTTKPGLRCIQDVRIDPDYGLPTSEDCLNLSVWTPAGAAPDSRRPVMVWIHGGGFLNGSSDIYHARRLAARGDIVVVTVNYRLGALGFLAHPALTGRSGADPGNYGLADQQQALRWVRDNIAGFGGDPEKVTIAGESAGAMSVCDHLVAPESWGLFRAAIMQSGPCQAQASLPDAKRVSVDFAAQAGCADPVSARACLLALPASRLEGGPGYMSIGADNVISGPVTGTERLPVALSVAAGRSGRMARVPVLIGSTADEFTIFVAISYLRQKMLPPYPELLQRTFGLRAAAVAEQYPAHRYGGSPGLAYAAAVTDGVFACPIDALATDLARHSPVFAYEFHDRSAPAPEPLRHTPFPPGAGHGLELRYLFDMGGAPKFDAAQELLSEQMVDYWSAFVRAGAPDADGQPRWPALNPDEPQRMTLQTGESVVRGDFSDRHRCGFWNG